MMSGICRHLISLPSMPSHLTSLPSRSLLVCCVIICLMASRSLLAAAATTGRRLPHTNPLTMLDAEDEDSTLSSQRGASNERGAGGARLPPDEVLTPESGEPYEVTKVHYLRDDWCKTLPLKQRIDAEGCISRTITNRFCYGQCNSFYIPKQSSDFNDAFRSCSFCKPYRITTFTVTLRCPGQTPSIQRKRVEKVKQCRCVAVDVS